MIQNQNQIFVNLSIENQIVIVYLIFKLTEKKYIHM